MSAAAVIAIRRKRLVRRFREAKATDPAHAVTLESLEVRPSWIFDQMARCGVFIRTKKGRFYMDEQAAEAFLWKHKKRALLITGFSLLVFLLFWIFILFGR